jgi:hypothetical protein
MQFLRRSESSVPLVATQVSFSLVSHKVLRWMSPIFAAGTFVSSLLLVNTGPIFSAALAVQAAVLGLGLAGCLPRLRRIGLVSVAHYFCLLQAAAAVGFLRGLAGRQSVLWQRFERVPRAAAGGARL